MKKVLFIHGFASSGQSAKAIDLHKMLNTEVIAPNLSHQPLKDIQHLQHILRTEPIDLIVGSSLGGFYALFLALTQATKLVLINPSLTPHMTLQDKIGDVESFKGGGFTWSQQQVDELSQLAETLHSTAIPTALLQNSLVLLAEQDERLNYKDAINLLHGANIVIDRQQDHRFSDIYAYQQAIQQLFLQEAKAT